MRRKFIIFCIGLTLLPSALAKANDQDFRVLKEMALPREGKAVVLVREDGHLLGQPFQVELRVNCQTDQNNYLDWPVHDSFSVCDLDPESLKINSKKSAIALKTKMADHANFEQQLNLGLSSPQVKCEESTTVKKFSLNQLCLKVSNN